MSTGLVNDEYYVLEYPDWVNVIAVTDRGEMVMVRQYRHGLQRTSIPVSDDTIRPSVDLPHPM